MLQTVCVKCGGAMDLQKAVAGPQGYFVHSVCPSEAERSGVLQGCLPSTNCSAGAGADARSNELNNSVVPREKAEPPGTDALLACPFCGSEKVYVRLYNQPSVCCENCLAMGPGASRLNKDNLEQCKIEAARAWNVRAGDVARDPGGAPPSGERALARNAKLMDAAPEPPHSTGVTD